MRNLTEILKDCIGRTFYSPAYGDVVLKEIWENSDYPLVLTTKKNGVIIKMTSEGKFTPEGMVMLYPTDKCTEWEEWNPICTNIKPVDGDILYCKGLSNSDEWIYIYSSHEVKEAITSHACCINIDGENGDIDFYSAGYIMEDWEVEEIRKATDEECNKLFAAMKDRGFFYSKETNMSFLKTVEITPPTKLFYYENPQYDTIQAKSLKFAFLRAANLPEAVMNGIKKDCIVYNTKYGVECCAKNSNVAKILELIGTRIELYKK